MILRRSQSAQLSSAHPPLSSPIRGYMFFQTALAMACGASWVGTSSAFGGLIERIPDSADRRADTRCFVDPQGQLKPGVGLDPLADDQTIDDRVGWDVAVAQGQRPRD